MLFKSALELSWLIPLTQGSLIVKFMYVFFNSESGDEKVVANITIYFGCNAGPVLSDTLYYNSTYVYGLRNFNIEPTGTPIARRFNLSTFTMFRKISEQNPHPYKISWFSKTPLNWLGLLLFHFIFKRLIPSFSIKMNWSVGYIFFLIIWNHCLWNWWCNIACFLTMQYFIFLSTFYHKNSFNNAMLLFS